jgi:ferritin-like metal-binding protein YciE
MASKRKANGRSRKQSPGGTKLLALELQQIQSAEDQLARELPRFAKTVESAALRRLLEQRLKQGRRLRREVDGALKRMDGGSRPRRNAAAQGLINDARERVRDVQAGPALDAVVIAGIQKTEHYCMAAWGTAKSLARATGSKEATRTMDSALKEGKVLDRELTRVAEREVTPALLAADDEEGDSTQRGQ